MAEDLNSYTVTFRDATRKTLVVENVAVVQWPSDEWEHVIFCRDRHGDQIVAAVASTEILHIVRTSP